MSSSSSSSPSQPRRSRVCIIGAGVAGLCALRHALTHNMDVTVYEQADVIGGTWVYSENIDEGPFGDEVHSSMYKGLRTNLPKEVMGFPDYLYPDTIDESFVTSNQVLEFLNSYADHFDLKRHIKFNHCVLMVRPHMDEWQVIAVNLKTNKDETTLYDYMFVCNGHYFQPVYPKIEGLDDYRGRKMHSHHYRTAETFTDEVVLIIGAGASGMDLTNHLHKHTKQILLSHHLDPAPKTKFMPNVTQKTDVLRFTENSVVFKDETEHEVDSVLFCTGYNTTFPFLSVDCGVRAEENYVHPLYKHCILINNPTMAIIGLPFLVVPTQLFDMQVRFVMKYFTRQKQLPSREEMLADTEKDMNERWARGLCKRQAHMMGKQQFEHYRDLAETADIENIKPVIEKIVNDCGQDYIFDLGTYRSNCFRVLNDENFVKFSLKDK